MAARMAGVLAKADRTRQLSPPSLHAHLVGGTPEAVEHTERTVLGQGVPGVERQVLTSVLSRQRTKPQAPV